MSYYSGPASEKISVRLSGGQRCSEENVEKLCQEGHEGYGYKGGNGTGPLCLEKYYWGSDPC